MLHCSSSTLDCINNCPKQKFHTHIYMEWWGRGGGKCKRIQYMTYTVFNTYICYFGLRDDIFILTIFPLWCNWSISETNIYIYIYVPSKCSAISNHLSLLQAWPSRVPADPQTGGWLECSCFASEIITFETCSETWGRLNFSFQSPWEYKDSLSLSLTLSLSVSLQS